MVTTDSTPLLALSYAQIGAKSKEGTLYAGTSRREAT
jgi:hypothetical protein